MLFSIELLPNSPIDERVVLHSRLRKVPLLLLDDDPFFIRTPVLRQQRNGEVRASILVADVDAEWQYVARLVVDMQHLEVAL